MVFDNPPPHGISNPICGGSTDIFRNYAITYKVNVVVSWVRTHHKPPFQQVGGLQQKVDEMEMTQRDIVAEYEEHVMHLKEEVMLTDIFYLLDQKNVDLVATCTPSLAFNLQTWKSYRGIKEYPMKRTVEDKNTQMKPA